MSKWLCKTTVFLFSKPFVAGLVIITLPTLSTNVFKFSFLPKSTIN